MAIYTYRNVGTNQIVHVSGPDFDGNPLWELVSGPGTSGGGVSQAQLDAVELDTTGPHGISDFTELVTDDEANAKVIAHKNDIDPHGDRAYTDDKADLLIPLTQKGAANGVATLGSDSKIPAEQVPSLALTDYLGPVANQAAMLALVPGQLGDWTIRTDLSTTWVISGADATQLANWTELGYPNAVTQVAGKTGIVTLAGEDIASGTVGYARLPVGISAGTVAAGDDPRFAAGAAPLGHRAVIFYAPPQIVNGTNTNEGGAAVFAKFDQIVFGAGSADPGDAYYASTVAIIARIKELNTRAKVFGYVDMGITAPSLAAMKTSVDQWITAGADGILFDTVEYGYGVTRSKMNEMVNYCHDHTLSTIINGFNPDDVMGSAVVATYNPTGTPTALDERDYYLLESWIVNDSFYSATDGFAEMADLKAKGDLCRAYRASLGVKLMATGVVDYSTSTAAELDLFWGMHQAACLVWGLDSYGISPTNYSASGANVGVVRDFGYWPDLDGRFNALAEYAINAAGTEATRSDLGVVFHDDTVTSTYSFTLPALSYHVLPVGTTAGTVAAGTDSRIVHASGLLGNTLNVADAAWGASPLGTNPVAALAAATAGQTVHFPAGTYTAPSGVGNGYTVAADNVTLSFAPGVTINVTIWGQAGIDLFDRSGVTITGRPTIQFTGTRGGVGVSSYRGSAPYVNGCGVYINRDRCRVEGLRTINMAVGVFLSSYNGTGATDRVGVGNVIHDLEVEGANWGILWVGQDRLRIDGLDVHDDVDDSSGANPTHAYYCSAATNMHATNVSIANVTAKNILTGQAFVLKFCDNVTLSNHQADNCKGLITVIDAVDLRWDGMGIRNSLANGGQGSITIQTTTANSKRLMLNNTSVHAATGVDERLVAIVADDSLISDMLIVSNRPGSPGNIGDYELIVRGARSRYRGVTIRSQGGHARAVSMGITGTPVQNMTMEGLVCQSTIGMVDVAGGSTGVVISYDPGALDSIGVGSFYIGPVGGAASFSVARSEFERLVPVLTGSTTPTPNPYLETRSHLNVTDNSNFTIGAPLGGTPPLGTTLDITITNSSGGALGTVTWNAAYTLLTSYAKPSAGQSTFHCFRHNGTSWVEMAPPTVLAADSPTAGEVVPRRDRFIHNTVAPAAGTIALSYFTADKTEAINTLTAWTGTVAAAATPTLCRMGIYSVASNGDLTLVASTVSDTALFAATNTTYAKALSATFNKLAGQRYATAVLVVTGATMPTFHGLQLAGTGAINTLVRVAPAIVGRLAAQTDLPSTIAVGSIVGFQGLVGMQLS